MSNKAKFKVGDKVARSYEMRRKTWRVVKIKATVTYDYLIEDKEGSRYWTQESGLRTSRKGK